MSADLARAFKNKAIVLHPPNAEVHGRPCLAVPAPDGFKDLLSRPIGNVLPTFARLGRELWQRYCDHPAFLLIPTSAPTMLMQGAFVPLEMWQWVYATAVTALMVTALAFWANRAFLRHVVMGAR